jgi:hypothetical protein
MHSAILALTMRRGRQGTPFEAVAATLCPHSPDLQRLNASTKWSFCSPFSMERAGIEPATFGLQSRRSPS